MNIKKEIIKYWKESPFWAKIFWVISTFFTISSITSLSDTVFAWKGFILDGLIFYRDLISPVKIFLASLLNTNISNSQADIIVFLGVFISAYRKFVTNRWLVSKPSTKITILFILINVILWLITMGFVTASVLDQLYLVIDIFVIFYLFYMLQYPTAIFAFNIMPKDSKFHETVGALMLKAYANNKTRFFIVYYSPIITAVVLVFIFAAINSGLTR